MVTTFCDWQHKKCVCKFTQLKALDVYEHKW